MPRRDLIDADPDTLSDALEGGRIVYFPECPLPFPPREDLDFLMTELPRHLRRKNISYHPEIGQVVGIGGGAERAERARHILESHNRHVRIFLEQAIAPLARNWTPATSSFRPLQEKGRNLDAHASNERVHVDAGAYGATHGNRILRFFMNMHPTEDRVWVSKGSFPEVYDRYGVPAGISRSPGRVRSLSGGVGNRLYSRFIDAVARMGLRRARLADSSPYDRLMRRFHNYMKDSEEFQQAPEGHREFRFPPGSAWMVFTDMVTHACVSGQFAFIDTFIVPLANCRRPALAPFHILQGC